MKKVAYLLLALCVTPVSRAVVIDDFSVSYFNAVQSGTWVDFQTGSMASGERDVMFQIVSNSFNQFADLDVTGAGQAVFSNGFGVQSNIFLQYDGVNDEATNTGPGTSLINNGTGVPLFAGFNDTLRVAFVGNDLDVTVTAIARQNQNIVGTNSALRAANSGAGNLDIAMDPNALAVADSVTFVFSGVANSDFAVTSLSTVPEPASMLGLAAGLLAIKRARQGNKK